MDQTEYQNPRTVTHSDNSSIEKQLVKKATKFFVSVSLFSLCFFHSSFLAILHSFNFYLSTFPYKFFTHRIDKNCIFLICNLLLVVLAKCSGLIRSVPRSYRINDETNSKNTERGLEFEAPIFEADEPVLENAEIGVTSSGSAKYVDTEEEKENELSINQLEEGAEKAVEVYREQDQEPEIEPIVSEKAEEEENGQVCEEEDGNGRFSSSTEELNKKFEDFIRKMKEELRLEAQRQLIVV